MSFFPVCVAFSVWKLDCAGLGKQKDSSVAHLAMEKDRPDLAIQFLTRTSPDTEEKIKPPCVNLGITRIGGHLQVFFVKVLFFLFDSALTLCNYEI